MHNTLGTSQLYVCSPQMCTTRKPLLVVITSTCAACASNEIHMPFSTMAAALGTPTAVPLPVSYREVWALDYCAEGRRCRSSCCWSEFEVELWSGAALGKHICYEWSSSSNKHLD